MYVPGQLSDVTNVLVDIGTGYYVEMVSCGWLSSGSEEAYWIDVVSNGKDMIYMWCICTVDPEILGSTN